MTCNSCENSLKYKDGIHPGCQNNGACGNMLDVHDWLANVTFEDEERQCSRVEVQFKATRKEIFSNPRELDLETGDLVVTESNTGYDIGTVTMKGELVKLQMKKKKISEDAELPEILRKASEQEVKTYKEAKARELPMMFETRRMAKELGLVMKVSDVEVQGDNRKATFYYTAEGRVDYRELIKQLGREFKVKVEMKQIGLRQEAGRIGGIGDCGRELCCSTWLTEFNAVPTVAAKYQNLFLNPLKLSGQCGRLKCCLNYELETYLEALEDFPSEDTVLETQKGRAKVMKIDILKRLLWFYFPDDTQGANKTYELKVESVHAIQQMNEKGEKPMDLEDFTVVRETSKDEEEVRAFQDAAGSDSITRFDEKRKNRQSASKKNRKGGQAKNQGKGRSKQKRSSKSRSSNDKDSNDQ
jgi:cell fate regulator YaaT (PSP1 superfamily)